MQRDAGHRTHPHTADTILEAWGPDLASCLTEVGRGLIEGFVLASPSSGDRRPLEVHAPDVVRLVAAWLNELLFVLDSEGIVPAAVEVTSADTTWCAGSYAPVPVAEVEQVGSVPKSVSLSGLEVSRDDRGYRCQVLVDI